MVDPEAGAVDGSWNVEVERLAERAAAVTNGFPDKDKTQIGTGYFRFETPNGTKDVYIKGKNSTLQGAANAINAANLGVRATILNDRRDPSNPYRLVISGTKAGGEKQVSYPTLYFLDGDRDIYFAQTRKAQNGLVKVDGFEFEVAENKVENVIPGVTLELRQAVKGRTVNVSVKENMKAVSGKVKGFVDSLNAVLAFIQQQNHLDAHTDTTAVTFFSAPFKTACRKLFNSRSTG